MRYLAPGVPDAEERELLPPGVLLSTYYTVARNINNIGISFNTTSFKQYRNMYNRNII